MAGTAMAESRDFDLKDFTQVDINTGITAVVTLGDSFSVHAESANKDLLDKLRITVDGGKLSASVDQNFLDFIFNGGVVGQLLGANNLTLNVTLPALSGVSASSAADVNVTAPKGDLDIGISSGADITIASAALGALRINASSGSDLTLDGTCTSLTANASSGSNVNADALKCATAAIEASSGSDVAVFASASIKANASSGSDITAQGNPAQQSVESSSGGDVTVTN
jgi:hypothetical protein